MTLDALGVPGYADALQVATTGGTRTVCRAREMVLLRPRSSVLARSPAPPVDRGRRPPHQQRGGGVADGQLVEVAQPDHVLGHVGADLCGHFQMSQRPDLRRTFVDQRAPLPDRITLDTVSPPQTRSLIASSDREPSMRDAPRVTALTAARMSRRERLRLGDETLAVALELT